MELNGTKRNIDHYGRVIDYLRISITDRCNLRCRYCMPDDISLLPMSELLTYEEILAVAEAAAAFGIRHLKVTGGEPLARKGAADLVVRLKQVPGIETVTLTTNGTMLRQQLPVLSAAGIDGINISLDTLDPVKFQQITRFDKLDEVLDAVAASCASGIRTKINTAVMPEVNADEAGALAGLAERLPVAVRFIEMMPIGYGRQCTSLDNHILLERLKMIYPDLHPLSEKQGYGPAVYYGSKRLLGSIGFISAVHGKFCDSCNRLRLTATGELKYCLCYEDGIDLRKILRQGANDRRDRLIAAFSEAMRRKPEAHCFERPERISEAKLMSKIGG